ncbi:MAG: thiamine phosphate synthase [Deltaproteobacteria bacterium]|nr:thiamine phosphate synthase [Deltaproteobacteria bacterium]
MKDSGNLRIIDANINRVTEGLRVIEDIFRYCYDNPVLQQGIKDLRHRVANAVDHRECIAHRDACSDVGFSSKGVLEYERNTLEDIIRSNMKRSQEGLRVLEEIFKLDSVQIALEMKTFRYSLYELEKKIMGNAKRILGRGLYLILSEATMEYEELARLAVSAGLPAIQLRNKRDNPATIIKCAHKIRDITSNTRTLFIVNDRPDIALAVQADGVHLGWQDIPALHARKILGHEMIIGLSTHNADQAAKAQDMPVDYIGFGPVFPTTSKTQSDPVTGIEALNEVSSRSRVPVVAIGGITQDNLSMLAGIACNNIAVINAVASAKDPFQTMTALHKRSVEIL